MESKIPGASSPLFTVDTMCQTASNGETYKRANGNGHIRQLCPFVLCFFVFVCCCSCQRTILDLFLLHYVKMSERMSDDDDVTVILASATIIFSNYALCGLCRCIFFSLVFCSITIFFVFYYHIWWIQIFNNSLKSKKASFCVRCLATSGFV